MAGGADLDALIARAQEGDVRAFEALVADHLPQVRRFARAFAASEADADDLAQEALVRVYKHLARFRYQAAFTTWLYVIVRNAFLDHAKSQASRQRMREEELGPHHARGLAGEERADRGLEEEQERARLWAALRQVPVEYRTAVVLFDIEGRSYDEVAAIEGVALGTVKSRISRGRAHLRRVLEQAEAGSGVHGTRGPGTSDPTTSSHPRRRES